MADHGGFLALQTHAVDSNLQDLTYFITSYSWPRLKFVFVPPPHFHLPDTKDSGTKQRLSGTTNQGSLLKTYGLITHQAIEG